MLTTALLMLPVPPSCLLLLPNAQMPPPLLWEQRLIALPLQLVNAMQEYAPQERSIQLLAITPTSEVVDHSPLVIAHTYSATKLSAVVVSARTVP